MQLSEAYELKETIGVEDANRLIQKEGWKLLAVGQRSRVGSIYVLGKPVPPPQGDWVGGEWVEKKS